MLRLRSLLSDFRVFRPYFPVVRTLRDIARFPLQYTLGKVRPFPIAVDLNVTNRCSHECAFCYNRQNVVRKSDELDLDAIERLALECAEWRTGAFLSGGEPLKRADLGDIIHRFRSKSLPVGLVTTAAIEDANRFPSILEAGLDVAVISFHGDREMHDRVLGHSGAYDEAQEALRAACRKMRSPGPLINYVLTPESVPRLGRFLDGIDDLDNLVVRLAHLSFLTPDERDAHGVEWSRRVGSPPPDLLNHTLMPPPGFASMVRKAVEDPGRRRVISKPVLGEREIDVWYSPDFTLQRRCTFVWQSTVVNADGTIFPCQYYREPMGNIRRDSLHTIWNGEKYRAFRAVIGQGLLPGCSRCCKL